MKSQEELVDSLESCVIWAHNIGYDGFDTNKAYDLLTPLYDKIEELEITITRYKLAIG